MRRAKSKAKEINALIATGAVVPTTLQEIADLNLNGPVRKTPTGHPKGTRGSPSKERELPKKMG